MGLFVGIPGWFVCFWCRAREALRQCLPDQLKDSTFGQVLKDDTTTKRWLAQLVKNLQEGQVTDPRGIPLPPQWSSPVPSHYSHKLGKGGGTFEETAQVLLPTGNRQPQCWTALERRGEVPQLRCMSCLRSQAALRTWAPSATPRKWAPDSSLPPQPQEGVNTSKCCICSMPKMTLLPHLYLATGREQRQWW